MADEETVGYVYLVEMGDQGIYKIGKTINVEKRLAQFGIQPPFPYRLLFAHRVPDMHRSESWLHKLYGEYRLNGEWFRLDDCQVKAIDQHLLTWQAEALIDRLAKVIYGVCHDASPEHLRRLSELLISAKERMLRRVDAYLELDRVIATFGRPAIDYSVLPETEAVS